MIDGDGVGIFGAGDSLQIFLLDGCQGFLSSSLLLFFFSCKNCTQKQYKTNFQI